MPTEEEFKRLTAENEALKKELAGKDNSIHYINRIANVIADLTGAIVVLYSKTDGGADFVTDNIRKELGISADSVRKSLGELNRCFRRSANLHGSDLVLELPAGHTSVGEAEYVNIATGEIKLYQQRISHIYEGDIDHYALILIGDTSGAADKAADSMSEQGAPIEQMKNYLSAMSHDFKISLNSITGFVLLLMKSADDPTKVMEYAHQISMSCQDLLGLVDRTVDMSRLQSGNANLDENEFALGVLMEELGNQTQNQAKAKMIQYTASTEGIEHDVFVGDRARIFEVLSDLLANAVKYTPSGGQISLTVKGAPSARSGYMDLTFKVRDTGIGMSRELQKHLLSGNGRRTSEMKGSGLGYRLARRLVDLMHGDLSISSHEGAGTEVTVRFSLRSVDHVDDGFWKSRGIHRLLIVDEDMAETSRIRTLMENNGVQTESTPSGYGAQQMIEHAHVEDRSFDLILLDRNVTDTSSSSIASEIRSMSWIKPPAIILMSPDAETLSDEEKKAGILGVIQKPFFVSTLRQMVEDLGLEDQGAAAAPQENTGNALSGLRFLVAEDNTINADILKELLELEGAKCEIAGNGKAAVAMFRNSRPGYYDMLLMDIQMPIMNGYDATREIRGLSREDAGRIPILAMTANTMSEDIRKSFESGMNAHIPKPLDIRQLNSTICKLKRKPHAIVRDA